MHPDPHGESCSRAQLANDESVLLGSGMLAQGYSQDDGTWVKQRDLQGMDGAGRHEEHRWFQIEMRRPTAKWGVSSPLAQNRFDRTNP